MQKRAVLLVDDDAAFVADLSESLRGQGCQVVTASDGAEGFERLKDVQPVLIVTGFADGEGVTFLTTLRERGLYEDVPKVIISSEDPKLVQARLQEAAVNAPSLRKDVDRGVLLRTVREAWAAP